MVAIRFRSRDRSAAGPVHDCGRADRMSESASYLAVVPAYNESDTIGGVVEALRKQAPRFDALVIDDGSIDDTSTLASRAGATVLRLPFNVGIGGAVQTGFVYARDHGYDFLAQV